MSQNENNLTVTAFPVGPIQTNCYIVIDNKTKKALVFDPGAEAQRIYEYIRKQELEVEAILFTHGHFDHITGGAELASMCGAKTYIFEGEKRLCEDTYLNCSDRNGHPVALFVDVMVKDRQELDFLDTKILVIATPGHTRGSVCYYFEKEDILISGDTLFFEAYGRTDLPTGSCTQLIESIKMLFSNLDDTIRVYPGHGEMTTIGYEKKNSPFRNGV